MEFSTETEYFDKRQTLPGVYKLGFGSTYSQSFRYGILTEGLDLKNKKCMLLGCGEGAGVPFLQARGCEDITGFDILERHVSEAKKRFVDIPFYAIKKTEDAFDQEWDYVFASGTWNVKTSNRKYEKIEELLNCAVKIKICLATNFTTNVPDHDDAHNFCYHKIISMFDSVFSKWKIDYTYFKNDFSIWGFK